MRERILVGVGLLTAWALGVGGGLPSGISLPPSEQVIELLPQAVLLWEAAVLRSPSLTTMELLGTADVDGDGLKDIVCSTPTGPIVFVWDRTGKLLPQACDYYEARELYRWDSARVLEPVAKMTALAAVLFDFDGDGKADLGVSVAGQRSPDEPYGYWLYTFSNRGGWFRREKVLPLPFPLHFLAVHRSEDGALSLLGVSVQKDESKVVLLPRDDVFGFRAPIVLATGQGWPAYWGDVTGDGRPDLLFLEKNVGLFLLPGEDFGFGALKEFPLPGVKDVARADAIEEGVPKFLLLLAGKELVVAYFLGASLQILGRQSVETWYNPTGLVVADFTGDGVPDAALFAGGERLITVLPGKGEDQFYPRGSEFFWVDVLLVRKQAVDLEGDGRADLLLASPYGVHVLRNGGRPRGISQLAVGELLAAGDLDGDGAAELLLPAGRGVDVLLNNGKGGLLWSELVRFPAPGPGAALGEQGEIVVEDLRVWNLRDISPVAAYVAKDSVFVLLKRRETDPWMRERWVHEVHRVSREGTVLGSLRLKPGEMQPLLVGGDLDGDGDIDVAMLQEEKLLVWWGGTSEVVPYPLPGKPYLLAVGDLTGDGIDEVVVVTAGEDARLFFLSFLHREPKPSVPLLIFDLYAVPMALALGDFDGDGRVDAAVVAMRLEVDMVAKVVSVKGGEIWLYCSQAGTTSFAIAGWPEGDAPWPLTGFVAGDFTGDGLIDLALTTVGGAGVFILPGRGDGSFSSPLRFPVPSGHLLQADLDGNGVPELIASRLGGEPGVWILWNGGAR